MSEEQIEKIKKAVECAYANNNDMVLSRQEVRQIYSKITKLEEENKILQKRNKILSQDITKDTIKCDVIQTVCGIPIEKIPELQDRIDKAIEYIHNNYPVCAGKDLLDILEGKE